MPSEAFTHAGRILKMEVDYSATVDEKIPLCQQLCKTQPARKRGRPSSPVKNLIRTLQKKPVTCAKRQSRHFISKKGDPEYPQLVPSSKNKELQPIPSAENQELQPGSSDSFDPSESSSSISDVELQHGTSYLRTGTYIRRDEPQPNHSWRVDEVQLRSSERHEESQCGPLHRRRRRKKPSVQAIRKYQSSTNLLLRKLPFARVVREIMLSVTSSTTLIQANALLALQEAAESYVICLMEDAELCALHANRLH